jgi:uncharacterized Zn-binding protein involved in type VI secretion
MGLPVVRMGVDVCSGHPVGFGPRPAIAGSPDVFVDGIPVVRVGDEWAPHTNIIIVHGAEGISGSTTVFCNGRTVMRSLDPLNCGSIASAGSLTTFCG